MSNIFRFVQSYLEMLEMGRITFFLLTVKFAGLRSKVDFQTEKKNNQIKNKSQIIPP